MDTVKLLHSLSELMEKTPPKDQISAFRGFKHGRTLSEQEIIDAGFDLYLSGLSLKPPLVHTVVALIHGIRTTGNWQEKLRVMLLNEKEIKVIPIGYGYFNLFQFISPVRDNVINNISIQLRDLRRLHPEADLIVVAHSFGTYIISRILKESSDIRISRLLLCGSIIPEKYRWDKISHDFTQQTVINEVGTKDYWPVVASSSSFGYGRSGSFGFKNSRVWDRFFDYGHSDFFTEEHFEKFWKPFILQGEVVNSPWDSQRPTPPWWLEYLGGTLSLIKLIIICSIIYYVFITIKKFII